MKPLRLCLVRHGETDWNVEHRMQGWTDIPLNARGRQQAQALAAALRDTAFDAVVSSPLQRALHTAQAVAQGREVRLEPRLRERHHGEVQGLTRDEMRVAHPALHAALVARRPGYLPPGGESIEAFDARVRAALTDLREAHAGCTVLAVAHGGVLDVVWRWATGQDLHSARQQPLPNAAINWLVSEGNAWRVVAFGVDAHLRDALDDQGG